MSHNSPYPSIPIGVDDYKKLIDNKSTYVDKTLLIKEFWQDGAEVILTPRPRRFGKTLNLSMLKYFFEKTGQDTSYLFKETNIWQDPGYRALQGQFPVIFLTFKDIKVDSWESAYAAFAVIISEECKRLFPSLTIEKIDASDLDIFNRLKFKQAPENELVQSLQFLSRLLYEQTEKKVIVLIDEYDAPIIYAYLPHLSSGGASYQQNYYPKMIKFMDNLLSKVLKSNTALKKGLLTGITRIAKAGIFSGLNHLSVCTVLNDKYSDKFGFTQKEVNQLLTQYDLSNKKECIKLWYDGYIFGQTNMYNPWSLLNCIEQKGALKSYWVNTSNNNLITHVIAKASQEVKDEIRLLLQGNILTDKIIDEGVTLPDIDKKNQEPWSFLLFAGYLTATSNIFKYNKYYYTLALPNLEIAELYKELVLEALSTTISFARLKNLFEAFIVGNKKMVEYYLQEFIADTCSSHDTRKDELEWRIHMFVLGLLAGLADRYIIQSNRESGDGRYDIMLMPRNKPDPGILIEFKKAPDKESATLSALAQTALEQIKSLDYKAQLKNFEYQGPILCYGIAAHGKHLVVNMEII